MRSLDLTLADFFCGAGGSSTGAAEIPGVTVRVAANHWQLAVDTHNENHPNADHICADLSQFEPRYFPNTRMAWFSPSCTKHSRAQGKAQATNQRVLFGEPLPDEAAERSRATMWDVVRFSEFHDYDAVMVENVVEVADWLPFNGWLATMTALGYEHRIISLNSMHAQLTGLPAAQSRDRLYIGFWKKGARRPDFEKMLRPKAYCPTCDTVVDAMQSWKRPDHRNVGRYKSQYVYRCPNVKCRNQIVEPGWLPASSIIDWSVQGTRIGDRDRLGMKALAAKTIARIEAGIERYWNEPTVVPSGGTWNDDARPTSDPMRTMTTREAYGLAVPVEGRDGKAATPIDRALRTMTTRNETGIAMAPFIAELRGGGSVARSTVDPLATVTASGNHHALIQSYYGTSTTSKTVDQPLDTVTTVDRHALIMRNNTGGAEMVTPAGEPVRTITTGGHQSVLTTATQRARVAVEDVTFRMLTPGEVKAAMAFPTDYKMQGTKREQVRMSGNAVTPPAARDLVSVFVEALS